MWNGEGTSTIVVDSDGRITALLELAETPGFAGPTSVTSLPLRIGDRILLGSAEKGSDPSEPGNVRILGLELPQNGDMPAKCKQSPTAEAERHPKLMEHAIETFGSKEVARQWLSSQCGVLNNESPNNFIIRTGNVAEIDRILTCIDYGMIA
jgi:hypothetical protein